MLALSRGVASTTPTSPSASPPSAQRMSRCGMVAGPASASDDQQAVRAGWVVVLRACGSCTTGGMVRPNSDASPGEMG